ncbi:MAG: methyltransferase regulatory domain-containing protein [Pirellulaceae bacterium]
MPATSLGEWLGGKISHNTFPGWHQRRMIRDMMKYHAGEFESPERSVQQGQSVLNFMTQAVPDDSAYGRALREEKQSLTNANASYIFHEQLKRSTTMYFHQFAQLAADFNLQYVSEIELSSLQLQRYPPQVADALKNMDIIKRGSTWIS